MLNLALQHNAFPAITQTLLKDQNFLDALIKMTDHTSIVIRGKCLLTFLLLFKSDYRWMTAVDVQVKFFHVLDKVRKDTFKYVQCCLLCLTDGVCEIVPQIFKAISEELQILLAGGQTQKFPSAFDLIKSPQFPSLTGTLQNVNILLALNNT